jgi:uncharacterized protein (TIGR03086 family)
VVDMTIDMHTGANRLTALVLAVPDDALSRPTPCRDYTVGDLLDHISGFAVGIGAAGRKDVQGMRPPSPGRSADLGDRWRTRIPAELVALATAWDDPAASEGMTGGPLDMPAEVAALVGVEELCIHGWDLARALGQPFDATSAELDVIARFFSQFGPDQRGSAYAPPVATSATDRLTRAIAGSGRDPNWRLSPASVPQPDG